MLLYGLLLGSISCWFGALFLSLMLDIFFTGAQGVLISSATSAHWSAFFGQVFAITVSLFPLFVVLWVGMAVVGMLRRPIVAGLELLWDRMIP